MGLFRKGDFVLHSGARSSWKIDCDALTEADWVCLAHIAKEVLPPFGSIHGVDFGGLRLAACLLPYVSKGPHLIVDDVCTTGGSLELERQQYTPRGDQGVIGCVVFARGKVPDWVTPLFQMAVKE